MRILLNVLLGGSVLFLPWWVSFVLVLALLFRYPAYEVVGWGLVMDGLYGAPVPGLFHFQFVFTALFSLLLVCSHYIKRQLVFYTS